MFVQTVRAQILAFHLSKPPERARSVTPSAVTFFHSATPRIGGFLARPGQKQTDNKLGSIVLRVNRSMRSLATMGSWAQPKGFSPMVQESEDTRKAKGEDGEKEKEGWDSEGRRRKRMEQRRRRRRRVATRRARRKRTP